MFEEEKAEFKSDLEELEAIYEKNKKIKPSPQTQTEAKEPILQPSVTEKVEKEQPPLPEVNKEVQAPIINPKFDYMATKWLERKFKKIDDDAAQQKKEIEDQFYDRVSNIFDPDTPTQILKTKREEPNIAPSVVVKDNSDAIRRINEKLLDPDVKDKRTLLKLRYELEGKTFEEEFPDSLESSKQPKTPEEKRGISIVKAAAIFILFAICGAAGIILAHVFHFI